MVKKIKKKHHTTLQASVFNVHRIHLIVRPQQMPKLIDATRSTRHFHAQSSSDGHAKINYKRATQMQQMGKAF